MLLADEHDHLVERCRCLPLAVGSDLVDDYVTNLLLNPSSPLKTSIFSDLRVFKL
jgi:hypothetical protein